MELDEHVLVYVSEPEHPEYHAPLDDDIQVEDDDEDPEEDPSEEPELEDDDKDPKKDPNEEHEPKDKDTIEPSKESSAAAAARAPRSQYDFINTTDWRDIRLEIDVVRGQRNAYETELQ
nr:hypothetical protein [Tanacetum cinerariifolium]